MSRAYRIRVSEKLTRVIHVEDGVSSPLEILDVLPRDAMRELVAEQLEKRGFARNGDTLTKDVDDVEVVVDLKEGTVSARVKADRSLDLQEERTGVTWEERATASETLLRQAAKDSLQAQAQLEEKKLQREVTEKLEKKLVEVRREVDEAVNRATGEALKVRARQMGEVEEIQEDAETGSLTIRVKV